MPVYEYKCSSCGELHDNYEKLSKEGPPEERQCPHCGEVAYMKFGCHMQPDSYWSGHVDSAGRYFTSKRQEAEYMKANHLTKDKNAVNKNAKKERQEKIDKRRRDHVVQVVRDFGYGV